MSLFYVTQAVSEYSTQISLLQLCTCVTARIKFRRGGYHMSPPLKETLHMCTHAQVPIHE